MAITNRPNGFSVYPEEQGPSFVVINSGFVGLQILKVRAKKMNKKVVTKVAEIICFILFVFKYQLLK